MLLSPASGKLASNCRTSTNSPWSADPGQLFVDGKAVYPKVDQTRKDYPSRYKPGVLTDADKNVYQYDVKAGRLLLTLGGDSPAGHDVRVPVRPSAFVLRDYCRLSGIHARNYVYTAIAAGGDDCIVEDCLVTDCGGGIGVAAGTTRARSFAATRSSARWATASFCRTGRRIALSRTTLSCAAASTRHARSAGMAASR